MALRLPVIRIRKLKSILNALIMQIETDGDNAEVNDLLVQALRTSVLAQVGPQTGQSALEALAHFEQAEQRRLSFGEQCLTTLKRQSSRSTSSSNTAINRLKNAKVSEPANSGSKPCSLANSWHLPTCLTWNVSYMPTPG